MENILVIGIAGGSGSGKTTLTKNLIERFRDDITVLSHDNYYRPYDEIPIEERKKLNKQIIENRQDQANAKNKLKMLRELKKETVE